MKKYQYKILTNCSNCNKKLNISKYKIKSQNFCGSCSAISRSNKKIKINCKICNKKFYRVRTRERK